MLDGKKQGLLDRIEEHKGDDEYLQVLYSTHNSFTLSWPALNRSITVDKKSLKTEEHDLYTSTATKVEASAVCGFLGILRIYGLDHFVIATERAKVCELPTYKQPVTNATLASIYALKKVKLIPFNSSVAEEETKTARKAKHDQRLIDENSQTGNSFAEESKESAPHYQMDKINEVVGKICSYLEEGFFFAYNYDLTSNLQRQRKLYEKFGFAGKDCVQANFSWNKNLFKQLEAQSISQFWCTHLMQGFIDRQAVEGSQLDLVLIARRGAERGGTRFLHRGIDRNGYVANFVELEQIVIRQAPGEQCELYSYAQVRGTFPFFWTQPNVSKFVIEKEITVAKPFFE